MLKPFLLVIAAGAVTLCSAALREVDYAGDLGCCTVTFENGYVVAYEQGAFRLYGPDGTHRYQATPEVPGAVDEFVGNVSVNRSGEAAAAVHYSVPVGDDRLRNGGGIALFDAEGKQLRFIATADYIPSQVEFAPDDSVYTIGYHANQNRGEHPDYFILRKYSRDGRQLLAALSRASLILNPDDFHPDPVLDFIGLWGLRAAGNRLGFWIFRDDLARIEWIETDLDGTLIGRWKLDKDRGNFAFSSAGVLYADGNGHDGFRFDPATASWKPVLGMPEGLLLGADADSLAFLNPATHRLRRFVPAQ